MITIYHADQSIVRDTLFYRTVSEICSMEDIKSFYTNGDYHMVGKIDTDSLEFGYMASQNIDKPWGDGYQRSTSVGDIVELDGLYYVVGSFGFDMLGEL